MRFSFCKNSVFCVIFFLSLLAGTICGVFLLRCILVGDHHWLRSYCNGLRNVKPTSLWLVIWFQLLPLLCVLCTYFLPHREKPICMLIFIRGCICAYSIGAYYALELPLGLVLLRNFLLFPVFYFLCRWLWRDRQI